MIYCGSVPTQESFGSGSVSGSDSGPRNFLQKLVFLMLEAALFYRKLASNF